MSSPSSPLPAVVASSVSAVLDEPVGFVPEWKRTGRRSDGKQAAKPVISDKPVNKLDPIVAPRKPYQKTIRFCRFEDHQYDREEKVWVPSPDGTLRMCPDKDCTFTHRVPRPTSCPVGDECTDHLCTLLHSKQRRKPCRFAENCINESCSFSHPATRRSPCEKGANCYDHAYEQQQGDGMGCPHSHPARMTRICHHNLSCRRYECSFLHHPDAPKDCPAGGQCQFQWREGDVIPAEQLCPRKHPRYTRAVEDSNGNFCFM